MGLPSPGWLAVAAAASSSACLALGGFGIHANSSLKVVLSIFSNLVGLPPFVDLLAVPTAPNAGRPPPAAPLASLILTRPVGSKLTIVRLSLVNVACVIPNFFIFGRQRFASTVFFT